MSDAENIRKACDAEERVDIAEQFSYSETTAGLQRDDDEAPRKLRDTGDYIWRPPRSKSERVRRRRGTAAERTADRSNSTKRKRDGETVVRSPSREPERTEGGRVPGVPAEGTVIAIQGMLSKVKIEDSSASSHKSPRLQQPPSSSGFARNPANASTEWEDYV